MKNCCKNTAAHETTFARFILKLTLPLRTKDDLFKNSFKIKKPFRYIPTTRK